MNEDILKQLRTIMREEMHLAFDSKFEKIDKRFDQVDKRFGQVDKRFGQVDKRFEQVDKHFDEADEKTNTLISEVDHIRRLTQANYELTKFVLEKHDNQIVEIQTRLNLPANPTKPLP